jgi:hypothetical protein
MILLLLLSFPTAMRPSIKCLNSTTAALPAETAVHPEQMTMMTMMTGKYITNLRVSSGKQMAAKKPIIKNKGHNDTTTGKQLQRIQPSANMTVNKNRPINQQGYMLPNLNWKGNAVDKKGSLSLSTAASLNQTVGRNQPKIRVWPNKKNSNLCFKYFWW